MAEAVLALHDDLAARAVPAPSRGSIPPPPPGFTVQGEGGDPKANVSGHLERAIPGIRFTSGYRSDAYNQDLKRRGYQAADNSTHLDGDTYDALPPRGRSLGWLREQVKRGFPDAETLVHDGHLHFRVPGSLPNAPVLGGARSAGVANPYADIPPPPPGFTIN